MKGEHVEERIQAWIDGELSADESRAVEAHCESCRTCGEAAAELREVRDALLRDRSASPLRPMWPAIRGRRERPAVRRFGLSFGFSASAAALAGLVLGIVLGPPATSTNETPTPASLTFAGSVLGDDAAMTLTEIYFAAPEAEGDTP